ncbi:MAG: hypothetical protein PW844_07325 [Pantoea sp.]|nr:hypothetical protein [Pantoea sp.]MDE1186271.1 hypothetical protein [Pantoea sp.]
MNALSIYTLPDLTLLLTRLSAIGRPTPANQRPGERPCGQRDEGSRR